MGEGFQVVLSEMATVAGNAPGAHPGRGNPGLHRSGFRSLWVGGRSLLCSRGSPMWLGTRREPCRAGAKPGGAGQIGKGVCQGCILSPCLFNFYAEYIMRNAGLEETQAGIKIDGIHMRQYMELNMIMNV